jgi:hypothetical protein
MNNRLEIWRWSVALVVCLGFTCAAPCQDGVCKKGDVPTNFVAVEEFNSPQCDDEGNPFARNAWRAEPVKDGVTACTLPRYEVIGPRVAEMVQCEAVESDKCSPRLDGLPNARVLRSPGECIKRKLPTDLQVECAASKGLTGGTYGYMIAQLNSPTCPPARPSNHDGHPSLMNAWLSQKVSDDGEMTSLAVCADDHNVTFGWVVRRFKNVNCPSNKYVEGGTEGLTGWIILLNPPPGATITVCAVFTAQSFRPFGPNYAAYHKATRYSELCGGAPNKPNSFGANFGVFTKGHVHVW